MALLAIDNSPSLNQLGRTVLEIDGKNTVLYIKLRWLDKIGKWMMSIKDERGDPIIRNIPLVASKSYPSADLLNQFAYMFIGSAAVLPTVNNPSTPIPADSNLGLNKEWVLVWGRPDGE